MNIGVIGTRGEALAVSYLKKKRYRILERNYQTRYGEIDLIARDGDYLVFVEVKTRKEGTLTSGLSAVDAGKQARIRKAAAQYWQAHPAPLQPRFDVIEVIGSGETARLSHLENAFDGGDAYGVF